MRLRPLQRGHMDWDCVYDLGLRAQGFEGLSLEGPVALSPDVSVK